MKLINKAFITAALFVLFQSFSVSQWVSVTSGTSFFLSSVQMITSTVNYAAGFSGTVLKSTNSGQTWSALTSPSSANINRIFFVPTGTATTGWAATASGLFKSTNGGVNWVQQISGVVIADLFFSDLNTGAVLTSTNEFRRTTNGGANFTTVDVSTNNGIAGVGMVMGTSSTFYILGVDNADDSTFIFKSTNSGSNWTAAAKFPMVDFSIAFVNANTGLICGDGGGIKRTTNGGTNWVNITSGTTNALQNIKFISSTKVYAVGSAGTILKSTDAGLTWVSQVSGTTQSIRGLDVFPTDDLGITCGGNGTMRRTTNGGAITGFIQQSNQIPGEYFLSQNYPNPFNPATRIVFSLPNSGYASLKIFDVTGRETAALVNEQLSAGTYEADFDASSLPSGTYFYRLQSGSFTETRKMILIK